ncbi:hypothetical protein [Deinococcus arenicola]|uniref:MBL fold metallo-hydrolase n=1 Tax=Deinococcus arenicola TaxID=2994950 RepID=A0ABU4DQV0_9DEIO|nr:hypothetical protein [Deinococcus sp. ZS9-10]MDV6374802.1 hypothetical protein [Deinococcus sp. ZS9-10]
MVSPHPPTHVQELRHPEVDPRIRWFRAGEEVDTFAVVTSRFLIFVDTMATPALMRQVIEAVRPDVAGRTVLVLNTHADWDHVYGNSLFNPERDLPGLLIASEATPGTACSPAPPRTACGSSRPRIPASPTSFWSALT